MRLFLGPRPNPNVTEEIVPTPPDPHFLLAEACFVCLTTGHGFRPES